MEEGLNEFKKKVKRLEFELSESREEMRDFKRAIFKLADSEIKMTDFEQGLINASAPFWMSKWRRERFDERREEDEETLQLLIKQGIVKRC